MTIEMRTHGLNWRTVLRAQNVFAALVTPAWHRDRLCQQQLAYARQLGLPIYMLVQEGTALPALQEGETAWSWRTVEECAALCQRLEGGPDA
jgi:hypothetical protein